MKKTVFFVILILAFSSLISCDRDGQPSETEAITTYDETTAADVTEPESESESLPCTEHDFNVFGVCENCGERRDCDFEATPDVLPDDALYNHLISAYKLKYAVKLHTSAGNEYILTKTLTDGDCTVCRFIFSGSYRIDGGSLLLDPAESGEEFTDFGGIANISGIRRSDQYPEILDHFPTGYICEGSLNRAQRIFVDGDKNMTFEFDDCKHENHDANRICTVCGRKVTHNMVNNVCTACGYKRDYGVKAAPGKYLKTCKQQGTVEKIVYDSPKYANGEAWTNTVFVYLPYGYADSDTEYNVLYLLHGSGENAAYWLAQLSYKGGYTESTVRLLDNLHMEGICEPTIVVTPTENLNGTDNFWRELEETLIPLIETKYRTKAHICGLDPSDVTAGDLINSRESRAFAGLSLGSIITWDVMGRELDKFAYFGFYSGGACNAARLARLQKALKNRENAVYPVKFAYHSCGTNDTMHDGHVNDYKSTLKACGKMLTDGGNTYFLEKPGLQHNYNCWLLDLYNTMAFDFFKY